MMSHEHIYLLKQHIAHELLRELYLNFIHRARFMAFYLNKNISQKKKYNALNFTL